MSWKTNAGMEWQDPRDGLWYMISDHNRSPIDVSIERIQRAGRMANGRHRQYVVAKKHTFSCSWELLPTKHDPDTGGFTTADGNMGGEWIEQFHYDVDSSFLMNLREGDGTITEYEVVFSDFSKNIQKRGKFVDLNNYSITLLEV